MMISLVNKIKQHSNIVHEIDIYLLSGISNLIFVVYLTYNDNQIMQFLAWSLNFGNWLTNECRILLYLLEPSLLNPLGDLESHNQDLNINYKGKYLTSIVSKYKLA